MTEESDSTDAETEKARRFLLGIPRAQRHDPRAQPDIIAALIRCYLFDAAVGAENGEVVIARRYLEKWGVGRPASPTIAKLCAAAGILDHDEACDLRLRIAQAAIGASREQVTGTASHDKEGGGGTILMTDREGMPLIRVNSNLLRLASDIVAADHGTPKPVKSELSGQVSLLDLVSGPGLPRTPAQDADASPADCL